MIEQLRLVHQLRQDSVPMWEGGLQFHTCLRSIFIGYEDDLPYGAKNVLSGYDALEFLIQIICGLHSPVIGETEVFGQFRKAVADQPEHPFPHLIKKAIEITKSVRSRHLRELGASSYGSYCRKTLKNGRSKRVSIVGAGLLAQEIVNWLVKDFDQIELYCRRPEKYESKYKYPNVKINSMDEFSEFEYQHDGGLIIAAPVSAASLGPLNSFSKIIDLRAESDNDSLMRPCISLKHVFGSLQQQQKNAVERKHRAIQAIGNQLYASVNVVSHRPFGWEDLCVS